MFSKYFPLRRENLWQGLAIVVIAAATLAQLRSQGRVWWCACGRLNLWTGGIWNSHNSQHFLDPYSFTHVLHGMVFCGLLAWVCPRLSMGRRLALAVLIEALWEILENSQFIIQRYREATVSLGYEGDSVVNSMADILCCAAGFLLARRLGFRRSLVVFVVTELILLFWIRDNLTLNVVMLIHPINAIKLWQLAH